MDELEALGFFHQSSDFDATQVMYCIDNEPSPTTEDTLIIETPPENIPTKEAPEVRDDFDKDFTFPEMLDDEKDDFSWLMKVCPTPSNQSDQTVPGEEFYAFDYHDDLPAINFNSINKTKEASPSPPEESVSMLVDVMLSEMDVSSLIANDVGNEITFHKDVANDDEIKEKRKLAPIKSSKSQTKKRSQILRSRTTTALTETPISLRRSQRKRSFTEMIQTEVSINKANNITGSNQRKNKRPRLQSTPRESKIIKKSKEISVLEVASTEISTSSESKPEPDAIIIPPDNDNKPVQDRLIIRFLKSKPVNPIDKSLVSYRSYQKGLIEPSKMLSGEMYLTQSCSPKLMPIIEEDMTVSKWCAKPMVPKKLKELLKMEWVMNHNTLANVKAHGKEMLGGRKLTSDGNAVRGTFATIDLDNEYESILQFQNEIHSVIDWKSNLLNKTHNTTEIETPNNLDITFSNFSNFNNDYFNEQLPPDGNNLDNDDNESAAYTDDNGIVGAVPVNKVALSKSSSVLCENWSVFKIKGQHYRSNPGVVIVERLSDTVIEQMKSRPKKVTLQSPYYKALTSYFETRPSSFK